MAKWVVLDDGWEWAETEDEAVQRYEAIRKVLHRAEVEDETDVGFLDADSEIVDIQSVEQVAEVEAETEDEAVQRYLDEGVEAIRKVLHREEEEH